jgi:hypothetical protein
MLGRIRKVLGSRPQIERRKHDGPAPLRERRREAVHAR